MMNDAIDKVNKDKTSKQEVKKIPVYSNECSCTCHIDKDTTLEDLVEIAEKSEEIMSASVCDLNAIFNGVVISIPTVSDLRLSANNKGINVSFTCDDIIFG
jgi:hypothetical protein